MQKTCSDLFAKKSVDQLKLDAEDGHGFKRSLTALDLTMLGVGATIGAGVYVLTGAAAASNAGPAVALSFVIASFAAVFAGLCYAEMASMIPVSGSAYAYSYATMGELVAWIIGWDLILEYLIGASTVSVGWSGYLTRFCEHSLGISFASEWTHAPITYDAATHVFSATGAIFNLPSALVSLAVTVLLIFGIRESARANAVIVMLKMGVLLVFIGVCIPFINPANWHPFIPENTGEFGHFGISGVFQGATMVFFSYVGFDAVSTASQEARNPQKDVPIGILGSLALSTLLYIAVALVLTGVVNYKDLLVPNPISIGIAATGKPWLESAVEIGAILGLSSVILVLILGQSRIFYSMANDGLFPKFAARIHPRYGTPHVTTMIAGTLVALVGGAFPIEILGELTSIGTLFAFVLVSLGVMILRIKRPDLERRFKVPGGTYIVPLLGAATSGCLMLTATTATIIRLFVWMAIGVLVYWFYGRRHSKLRKSNDSAAAARQR